MNVTEYQQSFILHFGEMGSRWGINRTVGQIYALLFVAESALNAEQITEALGLSRSNVSMGLHELKSWELVIAQHLPGDRREYFSTPEDVWAIFRTLAEQRRKREVDPTLTMLRSALMTEPGNQTDEHAHARMSEMLEFIELITGWFDDVQSMERDTLMQLMRLGGGVRRVLEVKDKVRRIGSGKRRNSVDAQGSGEN
ncbi:MAG: GbsR/MarR family transcriptional regulator [Gammaproteobacteria bacterium]